ncbi:MAG: multiheme c-type cytochrome [Pseudomonas sp.]|uniref:tetratricopeptide repeat protein n=1 Tax=Pseudomonas sp. TaxID=306 RepID=UPI0027340900|nr:tetratricopeptide repeat protein [Pseudomonas sp.]MDP3848225.1 multiheme c-type cytochrome [Pseudomonas sp.]
MLAATVLLIGASAGYLALQQPPPAPKTVIASSKPPVPTESPAITATTDQAAPSYVGTETCSGCHSQQHVLWKGSHHDMAMQVATDKTVLGDFNRATFSYNGITSTFFTRDGKFFVNTDGADGKLADFEIKYTFGVTPLQQYLVEFPGGRLQAFGIAWDSRSKAQGGQRWFHLYPEQKLQAGNPLHWTSIDQNWNYQCADCHSTNLQKNYDATSKTFNTQWSELNVGCEACHGPASNHLSWAKHEPGSEHFSGAGKGLAAVLDERRGVSWLSELKTGNASRSEPRKSSKEIETCATCHSRRGQTSDTFVHGQRLADNYRPSLLDDGLYWPDGQQRDEVFNHGSFLQSKMFAKGVTCSDCHEPHSLKLRAEGNGVCAQCHLPNKYDSPKHSFHPQGSTGAQCVSCHMPTTTYMQVDPRNDHSLRIPRPDLSVSLGTPNACNSCHTDKKPQWAAAKVQQWFPHPPAGHQRFAEAFAAASQGLPGADAGLLAVIADVTQPAIARAGALSRLSASRDQQSFSLLVDGLYDDNEMVRQAAVETVVRIAPTMSSQALPPLLADPVRGVRMAAARALAGAHEASLKPANRQAFKQALDEYIAAQLFNADRPESLTNLGALYAERGDVAQAEAYFRQALALDPFTPAAVNLASLYQSQSQEPQAERVLRDALIRSPQEPTLHHTLGLALARQQRLPEAVSELALASQLAPEHLRYRYVYAVALNSSGQAAAAIKVLEAAHKDFPQDQEVLLGLITFNRDLGDKRAAKRWAQTLLALSPNDKGIRQLLDSLEQ